MSFPAYQSYKESGVEWLGRVPSHWTVLPIRKAAKLESGHTPSRSKPEYWEDCTVPWFTLADVWQIREEGRTRVYETKEMVSELGLANSSARLLPAGTVILSRTASVGFSAIMGIPMATTQDFANWICGPTLLAEFLLACLKGMKGEFRRLMMGSTHNTIYMPDIEALVIAIPPLDEQRAIAAFLDRETAKIDALVAAQERLIALLKEKRQAVISHAVTKGLDPSAPMKDSGVEWLGQVPAHWGILPLRAVAKGPDSVFTDGDWIESKDISDEGIRYITTGNVGEGVYKEQGGGFITEETFHLLNCTEVFPGDVLISRLNPPIGRACVVPDLGARIVTSVDNVIVRAGPGVVRRYLVHLLSAKSFFAHMDTLARGTTMQRVSRTILGNVRLCVPPPEEQAEIVDYVNRHVTALDQLAEAARATITLLQERRAALISAAVTGKIDVRGLVQTAEAA